MTLLRVLLAIILPPLVVFMEVGFGWKLMLNIILTLLGWLPGMAHAFWVLLKKKDHLERSR